MEKKFMGLSWSLGIFFFIMSLVAAAKSVDNEMSCPQALAALLPCQPFLTGVAAAPVASCCLAVTNVIASATTTEARRDLCQCLKNAAPALGVKPDSAKQLPQLCGLSVSVPIDPTINCSNIP